MLTKKMVLESCEKNGLYRTPNLNDKLYLHFKGLTDIANLEEYDQIRVLWIEGNCIREIKGLEKNVELRHIYLHQNMLDEIGTGLQHLVHLVGINLSENFITKITDLSSLVSLSTLQLKSNRLATYEDIAGIATLPPTLQVLDLGHNKIEDARVIDLLEGLPNLSCLYLHGNPVCSKISPYRKTVVARLKGLRYLDDRPVFDDERRLTNAWARGGADEEKKEREIMREEEEATRRRHMQDFADLVAAGRRERREAGDLNVSDDTDYTSSDEENQSSLKVPPPVQHTEFYEKNYGKNREDKDTPTEPAAMKTPVVMSPSKVVEPAKSPTKAVLPNENASPKKVMSPKAVVERHEDPMKPLPPTDDFWVPS
jgi:dynein assembly factor 1